jgi:HAE1 family hydrophobic/amphiphilic exporter-1
VYERHLRQTIQKYLPADNSYTISYEGGNTQIDELIKNFSVVMVIAICLVFGVMASLFESFKDPLIIVFCIPLSFIGIVIIHLLTKEIFNALSVVGFLVLIGVIVNNGIVLVDYINLLRKRGLNLHDACVKASGSRLRPILMSTLTTVIGLIPMAFSMGVGAGYIRPIGLTVLGGLSFGTIMTLLLMPVVYAIFNTRDEKRKLKQEKKREKAAAKALRRQTLKQEVENEYEIV